MAILTSSLVPFPITSIPDRLTPLYCCDKTSLVTTAATAAVQRLNRVQSTSFGMATPIMEVSEMGDQSRVGGADELGEVKWKVEMTDVGVRNLAHLMGIPFDPTTSGQTFSAGLTQFQNAQVDFIRMAADSTNTIFESMYMQDCIIDDYSVDLKMNGLAMDTVNGRGPNAVAFPGFFLPKTYLVTSGDVSAGYLNIANVLGTDEAPVEIYLPTALATPAAPAGTVTTGTGSLAAATYYARVAALNGSGTTLAGAEASAVLASTGEVSWTVASVTGAVQYAWYVGTAAGAEVLKHVTSSTTFLDNGSYTPVGTALPTLNTTAIPSYWQQNGAQYFLKIEKLPGGSLSSAPVRYYEAFSPNGKTATYNSGTQHLTLSDSFSTGDVFRLVMVSYNTDSFPLTVPSTSPDTLNLEDRAGVTSRMIPIDINAAKLSRAQSCSIKFSWKRDHVQGLGENSIVYGVAQIPDVAISFDVKESDMKMLSLLSTGSENLTSQGGTIANDWQDLNYLTRVGLAMKIPFSASILDPFNISNTLVTYSSPQLVIKDISFDSTNKADNTVKITAEDITGLLSLSYTVPA